jgi:hypothetical protein
VNVPNGDVSLGEPLPLHIRPLLKVGIRVEPFAHQVRILFLLVQLVGLNDGASVLLPMLLDVWRRKFGLVTNFRAVLT